MKGGPLQKATVRPKINTDLRRKGVQQTKGSMKQGGQLKQKGDLFNNRIS